VRPDQLLPERFTEAVYQEVVAGRPRLAGALAALEYFGVPGAERRAQRYAAVKQEHLIKLIEAGDFAGRGRLRARPAAR
jgi:beta-phosphoglucomutase